MSSLLFVRVAPRALDELRARASALSGLSASRAAGVRFALVQGAEALEALEAGAPRPAPLACPRAWPAVCVAVSAELYARVEALGGPRVCLAAAGVSGAEG